MNVRYRHELEAWRAEIEFEAWRAWRREATATRLRDRELLSIPVRDAWNAAR